MSHSTLVLPLRQFAATPGPVFSKDVDFTVQVPSLLLLNSSNDEQARVVTVAGHLKDAITGRDYVLLGEENEMAFKQFLFDNGWKEDVLPQQILDFVRS